MVQPNHPLTFPAVRGIQATREYFVIMCRLRYIDRLSFVEPSSIQHPRQRAQRLLTKSRIPKIRDYIVNNPTDYVLPALTMTVDSEVEFEAASGDPRYQVLGILKVPASARFLVNDGQHRLAGIRAALAKSPVLADETISCVVFVDTGLRRAQRIFNDLNKHALRPSRSLCVLYDHNDPLAALTRSVVDSLPIFAKLTDLERSSVPRSSSKLFTLSGLYRATVELVGDSTDSAAWEPVRVLEFWDETSRNMAEWEAVRNGLVPAAYVREQYIHCCALGLIGIGRAGHALLREDPEGWRDRLRSLGDLDWNRDNRELWEGRATIGGRITTSRQNEILVGNRVKMALGLPLDPGETSVEAAFATPMRVDISREANLASHVH